MKKNNKSNIGMYTAVCTGVLALASTMYMTGTSLKEIDTVTNTKTLNTPEAQIEQYIKEENTDNSYGDAPRAREVSGNTPLDPSNPDRPTPSTPIDATDIQSLLWKKLKAAGFSDKAAAAVHANIGYESGGYNMNAVNPDSGAYGLCQWLGGRQTALKSKPNYNTDANVQIDFFLEEWAGFNYDLYCSDSKYAEYNPSRVHAINAGFTISDTRTIKSTSEFMSSDDMYQCTYLFMLGFERPGKSNKSLGTRCANADTILRTFGGKS